MQNGARNHPWLPTILDLSGDQLVQVGARPCPDQTGMAHQGARQRNDPLHIQLPGREQATDGDDGLIIQMPDRLGRSHRVEVMNMSPDQPRRMRP